MIRNFRKGTDKIYRGEYSTIIPVELQRVARRKLLIINAAIDLNDLKVPPGNHLKPMHGNRKGQYSIRINNQYRICFTWDGSNAHDVEITDYH